MPSLVEAIKGVYNGSVEILFLNEVLREYREVRKVYHYEYEADDKSALQACATDMRPLTYAALPGTAVWWSSGKVVREPKRLSGVARGGLLFARLMATLEAFRLGYLIGTYKQGIDCTQRLVSLQTPLGGEVVAIIRNRDPSHPLLRWERPPAELNGDGSRPRIAAEHNRLARIAQLRKELAQAKQGQAVDRANEQADERLFQLMGHQQEVVGEIQRGGGPTAAANAGSLGSMQPQQAPSYRAEYQAAGAGAAAAGGSLAGVVRSGGLVITDTPPLLPQTTSHGMQRAAADTARSDPGSSSSSPGSGGEHGERLQADGVAASSSADPFSMLLGGGTEAWQGEGGGAGRGGGQHPAESEEARQQRRKQRRARWWRGRREEDS